MDINKSNVKNTVTSSGITKNFKSLTSTITKKEDTISAKKKLKLNPNK